MSSDRVLTGVRRVTESDSSRKNWSLVLLRSDHGEQGNDGRAASNNSFGVSADALIPGVLFLSCSMTPRPGIFSEVGTCDRAQCVRAAFSDLSKMIAEFRHDHAYLNIIQQGDVVVIEGTSSGVTSVSAPQNGCDLDRARPRAGVNCQHQGPKQISDCRQRERERRGVMRVAGVGEALGDGRGRRAHRRRPARTRRLPSATDGSGSSARSAPRSRTD